MASIEARNGSWRIVFRHNGEKHHFTLGEVDQAAAEAHAALTEQLLRDIKRHPALVPPGCDVATFMFHRGKPPEHATATAPKNELTLEALREKYLAAQTRKLEETTLAGIRLHFGHLTRILGAKRLVAKLTHADLQAYVERRSDEWIDPNVYRRKRREKDAAKKPRKNRKPPPPESEDRPLRHPSAATIRKEIVSLRTAWNWARRRLDLAEPFPGARLDYAKTVEPLPFMTWEQAEHRIAAGDDPDQVWDCVYLRPEETAQLLASVKGRPVSPWVYPMFAFAAHTGARRSEIIRVLPSDLDLAGGVVTIREKKRDKTKLTTRNVPLTPLLKDVLADWMQKRAKGKTLFCKSDTAEIKPREAHNYFWRALRRSKWSALKGWHVFRHSFISALASKGVDQRIIDDLVGHCTEEQRRRYRHLFPNVKQDAVCAVFS